jgi:hypothetical protein
MFLRLLRNYHRAPEPLGICFQKTTACRVCDLALQPMALLHPIKFVGTPFRAVYQSADVLTEGHVVPPRRLPSGVMLIWEHKAVQWCLLTDQLGWAVSLHVITLTSFCLRRPVDLQVLSRWHAIAPSKDQASDRLHTCSAHAQLTACTLRYASGNISCVSCPPALSGGLHKWLGLAKELYRWQMGAAACFLRSNRRKSG